MRLITTLALSLLVSLASEKAGANNIELGIVADISGQFETQTREIVAGAQFIIDNINASGGVLGRKLSPSYIDSKCAVSSTLITDVRRLVEQSKIRNIFLANICGAQISDAAKYINDQKALGFITSSGAIGVTPPKERIFRLSARADTAVILAARAVAIAIPSKEITIIGQGELANLAQTELKSLGLSPAVFPDIAQIQKNTELYFITGRSSLSTRRSILDKYQEAIVYYYEPANSRTLANYGDQALLKRLESEKVFSGDALNLVAALQVWKAAYELAKGAQETEVAGIVNKSSFKTIVGTVEFNKDGDVKRPLVSIFSLKRVGPEVLVPSICTEDKCKGLCSGDCAGCCK